MFKILIVFAVPFFVSTQSYMILSLTPSIITIILFYFIK